MSTDAYWVLDVDPEENQYLVLAEDGVSDVIIDGPEYKDPELDKN